MSDRIFPSPGQIEAAWAIFCTAALALPVLVAWLFYPTDETV